MNNFKSTLNDILIELNSFKMTKDEILYNAVSNRLSKSLEVYYSELRNSYIHNLNKNGLNTLKRINKEG